MKKSLPGIALGLALGGAVALFYAWVAGSLNLRLDPPGLASFTFGRWEAALLVQCLLAGAVSGGLAAARGRGGLAAAVGLLAGFGLGFFFIGRDDPPWDNLQPVGMLLPLLGAAVLAALAGAALRLRQPAGQPAQS